MSLVETAAKIDKLFRPLIAKLPPIFPIHTYSLGRRWFLNNFFSDIPENEIVIPNELNKEIWGLTFQSSLFNAAGMFKEAFGYEVVRRQGAGAFLIGTVTPYSRKGNSKYGYNLPFLPMPQSKAALNWLGLPNAGFDEIAKRIGTIEKKPKCPIGVSLAAAPEETGDLALINLLRGFEIFSKTQIDFIELNESCPNVIHDTSEHINGLIDPKLIQRLTYISENFLKKRNKKLPVIVKFSIDIDEEQLLELIKILIELEFDGINLGNTSTQYEKYREFIAPEEVNNFEYFINNFGGGFSGNPLKSRSYTLSNIAINEINKLNLKDEFVVIRTGGIDNSVDILQSNNIGVSLNQWFTGYFELFSSFGHQVYKYIYNL